MDLTGGPWAMSGPCSPHQTWSWPWPEYWLLCLTLDLLHHHTLATCAMTWTLGCPPTPTRPALWLGVVGQALAGTVLLCWPQYPPQLLPSLTYGAAGTHVTTHGCILDTKMISKNNFVLYLPQVISRVYLWTRSVQQKTQEPKDVRSFPSGSHPPACPSPSPR